jgi:hypothetical protein
MGIDEPPSLRITLAAALPFALGAAAAGSCYAAAGMSLGFFFGGVILATLLAPPLLLGERGGWRRAFALAGLIDGVGIIWLVAGWGAGPSLGERLLCYLLLTAYITPLAAAAILLERLTRQAVLASAIVVVLALAWLAWPIWLSPWLEGQSASRTAAWLVPAHPLLTMNGLLRDLGIWSEFPLAYRLTNLNQHVLYRLPGSIWPCVAAHLLIAGALAGLAGLGRGTFKSTNQIDPSASTPSAR